MNLYRLAVIVLRIIGITWIIQGSLRFLEVPKYVLLVPSYHVAYYSVLGITLLSMLLLHVVLEAGAGIVIILYAKPLAKFLTDSFTNPPLSIKISPSVWPPPPKPLEVTIEQEGNFVDDYTFVNHQVAMLLLRTQGIGWFIFLAIELTELPSAIYALLHHYHDASGSQYLLEVSVYIMTALISLGVALYFFFLPDSLAHRITRDLVQDAEVNIHKVAVAPLSEDGGDSETMTGR